MDNRTSLKNNALGYMYEYAILNNFQTSAVNHSKNCWKSSSPLMPLILDLEIDLILLFVSSSALYEKILEYPAEGRRIFQEATSDYLRDYLLVNQCQPINCVQLLIRCKFFSKLKDGNSLYAKSYGCLSYFQRYVLTSVTISRSDKCNVHTVCAVTRCTDYKCPGNVGKQYTSTEELGEGMKLDNCDYCGKKCYEDAAGRGVVRRVMVKFSPVKAFNCRDEKAFHTSLTCSITDPLVKELELGDMYDIWGCYNISIYEIWGLKRTTLFPPRKNLLSSLPTTICKLWTWFGEAGPIDPWSFARILSLELGSNIYKKNASVSLKMGLLLSLASLGNDRCASIFCVGPNIDIVENDIMKFAANCADRNVPAVFPIHANIATKGQHTWLHSGSLLMAKTGVFNVGDWESLDSVQQNDHMLALDDGYMVRGQINPKSVESEKVEYLSSSLPLKTAVWTYLKCEKNYGQRKSPVLENLVNLIGIPFLADVEESVTSESVHERFELTLDGGKKNPRKVQTDDLIEYLRIVNGIAITLSEEAGKLMKDYFVASRKVRKNGFPSQSITFVTTLAKAHARLSLRSEVTYDDVVAIIYLYEESMCFLYGYSISTPPPFMRHEIDEIPKKMVSFKIWLKRYLTSLVG